MKTLFIEAKGKFRDLSLDFSSLPKRIGLLSTVQYVPLVSIIEKEIRKSGRKVFKSKSLKYETQILGCNLKAAERIKDKVDCFLLLSSGKWHSLMVAMLGKPVFIYDGELKKLPEEEVEKSKLKKKAALLKFLSEDEIGIIVSLKHGQYNLKKALNFKNKIEKKGKKAFIFIADTITIPELENYKIKIWVNTACPGLSFDSSNIINITDLHDISN